MKLKCFEIFQYVTNSREGFHQPLPPGVQRWGYDCVYIRGLKESRLAGCKPVGYPQLAFRAGIELEGGGGGWRGLWTATAYFKVQVENEAVVDRVLIQTLSHLYPLPR